MPRLRAAAGLLAAAALLAGGAGDASAHSGLTRSDPAGGATLGASPTAVTLTFSERPEASLAEVKVLDRSGASVGRGGAEPTGATGLAVPVGELERGVYSVTWRVVSAVDGHASSGAYAFGVGVSPAGATPAAPPSAPSTSALEVVARWILLIGLTLLTGAAVAAAARFGGSSGTDARLAATGWAAACFGLALLALAQRDAAGSSLGDLLSTPVGEALIWRAVALAVAGAGLLLAWRRQRLRRPALAAAAVAAVGAIVVHVDAGHAAAGSWPELVTVIAQASHFVAAGVWFGGLAALLLGVRGEPSDDKTTAVRRFSSVALGAIVLVAATGTVRSIDELSSWDDLFSSGYGRAVLAKVALLAVIVALASRSRRLGAPSAATDLGPLRRTTRPEIALAVIALATAALLGSLAPAVSGQGKTKPALSASGADFGTTVRVRLTAASAEPGPNRLVAHVEDYDSEEPVSDARVRLRFTPLDDPGVEATSLTLRREGKGSYAGSGANLAFVGRWRVTALIERNADAVEVPLTLVLPGSKSQVSVLAVPGKPTEYTVLDYGAGYIQITPNPGRPGPSRLSVTLLDVVESPAAVRQIVVTTKAGDGPTRQRAVEHVGRGRFAANIELEEGPYAITIVARTDGGVRLHRVFELEIPGG